MPSLRSATSVSSLSYAIVFFMKSGDASHSLRLSFSCAVFISAAFWRMSLNDSLEVPACVVAALRCLVRASSSSALERDGRVGASVVRAGSDGARIAFGGRMK